MIVFGLQPSTDPVSRPRSPIRRLAVQVAGLFVHLLGQDPTVDVGLAASNLFWTTCAAVDVPPMLGNT